MTSMRSKSTLHKVATRNTFGGIRVAGTSNDASAQLISSFRTLIFLNFFAIAAAKNKSDQKTSSTWFSFLTWLEKIIASCEAQLNSEGTELSSLVFGHSHVSIIIAS